MLLKKAKCFVETMYKVAVGSAPVDMWPGRGMKLTDNYLTRPTRWQMQSR